MAVPIGTQQTEQQGQGQHPRRILGSIALPSSFHCNMKPVWFQCFHFTITSLSQYCYLIWKIKLDLYDHVRCLTSYLQWRNAWLHELLGLTFWVF